MSRIAIVSAMHEELRALLPALEKPQRAEFAGRAFHFGQMQGQPVVMVLSGIADQTSRVPGLASTSARMSAGTVVWPFAVMVDSIMASVLTSGAIAMRTRWT